MDIEIDPAEDHDPALPGSGRRRFLAGGAIVAAAAATAAVGVALPQSAGAAITGTMFFPLPSPKRVYDSRPGTTPATGPKTQLIGALSGLSMSNNSSGVPTTGVAGVMVSLTVTNTSSIPASFMTIYKNGTSLPLSSNLNWWGAGQTLAVTTFSAVDANSKVALFASSSTDVIVDVLGYYA